MDQGFDFYAPQTFTSPDGRKILFAWMSRMEEEEEKLFGEGESSIHCMTLPREISYRNGELCQLPVRELEKSLCIHKISEQERQSGEIILKNRVYCAKLSNLQNETSFKIEFQNREVILEYKKVEKNLEEAKEMMNDPELKELAETEMLEAKEKLPKIEEELKILLIPKDPDDDKNVICEIRGGAGGDEAALFAGTLYRMYSMYAERKHWKLEVLNENETELGGYKEISFMISGRGAYSRLKFESGVHRVQRVPDTEASGRIHTSTATVAVLPEVEDVDIELNPADIKMEVFRSSGAGGQHVNKTSSAVRLIHIPTGMVAECQTERSQVQNREYAMRMLRSRLYEKEKQERDAKLANERKTQVGSGDRSEKIRTYNYPQGRITDHRIGMSIYQIEDFLNGNLDEMIDNLIAADRAEKLKSTNDC